MTVPVVYACAVDNPQWQITVLSREFMSPLFARLPSNVQFRGVDLKAERYRGIRGLGHLYGELKQEGFDSVADLHDVLRSQYLRLRFRIAGKQVAHIRKGRKEKKLLVKHKGGVMRPLKSSFRRYAEVLDRLGLRTATRFTSLFPDGKGVFRKPHPGFSLTRKSENERWVGMAPFAAHPNKEYPESLMERVIEELVGTSGITWRIYLFGARSERERDVVARWQERYPQTASLPQDFSLDDELVLMNHLDVMVSMDSANMHLASLAGIPVVSVWGPTHPYAGFMGWNQREEDAVQTDYDCRPCSIFGNKPCRRERRLCMEEIAPRRIVEQVMRHLLYNKE